MISNWLHDKKKILKIIWGFFSIFSQKIPHKLKKKIKVENKIAKNS